MGIHDPKRFRVTDEHLKLVRRMYFSWEDGEFGAPAVDSKRPYGNSGVYTDMMEILGWDSKPTVTINGESYEVDAGWEIPLAAEKLLRQLHEETRLVLQIAVQVGEFKAGIYESDELGYRWKAVPHA